MNHNEIFSPELVNVFALLNVTYDPAPIRIPNDLVVIVPPVAVMMSSHVNSAMTDLNVTLDSGIWIVSVVKLVSVLFVTLVNTGKYNSRVFILVAIV